MSDHEYVTGAEFKRWMDEESTFRERIERRMENGFTEVKSGVALVASLQRDANGKTAAHERAIAVMQRDVEAIRSEDLQIARDLDHLRKDGCGKYAAHVEVLGTLAEPSDGVVLTERHRPAFRMPDLSRKQKAVAGVSITAILIPAIADLFRFLTAAVAWLAQLPHQ